jgi:hypothetical protein
MFLFWVVTPKRRYLPTSPHDVTTQKTSIDIFTAVITSNHANLVVRRRVGDELAVSETGNHDKCYQT